MVEVAGTFHFAKCCPYISSHPNNILLDKINMGPTPRGILRVQFSAENIYLCPKQATFFDFFHKWGRGSIFSHFQLLCVENILFIIKKYFFGQNKLCI